MVKITPNFTLEEFVCPCGCLRHKNEVLRQNLIGLCRKLEKVRHLAGDKPVTVLSGIRCATSNAQVGGAVNSYHIDGKAADIRIGRSLSGMDEILLYVLANEVFFGGIGVYGNGFVHVDNRGSRARWGLIGGEGYVSLDAYVRWKQGVVTHED